MSPGHAYNAIGDSEPGDKRPHRADDVLYDRLASHGLPQVIVIALFAAPHRRQP